MATSTSLIDPAASPAFLRVPRYAVMIGSVMPPTLSMPCVPWSQVEKPSSERRTMSW